MQILSNGIAIIEDDTHIGAWVKEHGRLDFDQNALPFILEYIHPGDVVIDAGANIGAYSFAFLNKIGNIGKCYCFEPNLEAFECLKHNLSAFNNAFTYQKALSYQDGYVNIIKENKNAGMAFCEEAKYGFIKSIAIDSQNIPANFIKIDVEGFEVDVLNGATKTIAINRPILFIEINTHTLSRRYLTSTDVTDWLTTNNYSFKNIYPGQEMFGDQYDIICIPNEKTK